MKTLIFKLVALGMFAAVITGCSKDEAAADDSKNTEGFKAAFSTIVNANQPQKHTLTVSANNGAIILAQNTRLTFLPGAFITANGAAVNGNVQLEVQEIAEKWQMVLANKTTISTQGLLKSAGEAFINAKQNGQQLRLRPGYSTIQFNASTYTQPMNFYIGQLDATNFNNVTWEQQTNVQNTMSNFTCSQDSVIGSIVFVDNSGTIPVCDTLYTFPLDSLGWINCDYVANSGAYPATLALQTQQGFDNKNTNIYLVFKNMNAVGQMTHYLDGQFISDAIHGSLNMPVGEPLTIVAIGYKDGKTYSGFKETTLSANSTVSITLTETTKAAYEAAVKNL